MVEESRVLSSSAFAGGRRARHLPGGLFAKPAVQHAPGSAAEDWSDPKQPKLADGPAADEEGRTVQRAGLTEVLVTGMLMRWIRVKAEANRNRREAGRRLPMRRAHDDEQNIMLVRASVDEGREEAVLTG